MDVCALNPLKSYVDKQPDKNKRSRLSNPEKSDMDVTPLTKNPYLSMEIW